MKYITKLANLLLVWLPIIITFSIADNNFIPFSNITLDELDETVCEKTNDHFPYAVNNFAVSFLFMLLPVLIVLNVPFITQIKCSYTAIETIVFITVLVYNATASGLYYGFSTNKGKYIEKSGNVWTIAFVLAKTLSKIPHTDFGIVAVFWSVFICYPSLFDPYLLGLEISVSRSFNNIVFVVTILEFAYAKWQERRSLPEPFMFTALVLFNVSSIFIMVDESDQIICDENSNFQWLPAARSFSAVALSLYFFGFRKQAREKEQVVQNRFEEVNQREDDDQLI